MSQEDGKKKTIAGTEYGVRMLDALTAEDLLIDIGHVVGPSLGGVLAAFIGDKGSDKPAADPEMINGAVAGLFARLDKKTIRSLITTLSEVTDVYLAADRSPLLSNLNPANHFRGKLGAMHEWIYFALEVQYSDFFASVLPAIKRAVPVARAAASKSRPTSDDEPTSG